MNPQSLQLLNIINVIIMHFYTYIPLKASSGDTSSRSTSC